MLVLYMPKKNWGVHQYVRFDFMCYRFDLLIFKYVKSIKNSLSILNFNGLIFGLTNKKILLKQINDFSYKFDEII